MQKIFFSILLFFSVLAAQAQFKSARLQAAGLTCAMCTKAIHESLKELTFVESVKPDIKNSEFIISFKENANVDPDVLKKAVEDAGFSVAKLRMTTSFDNVKVQNDSHVTLNGRIFHFIKVPSQTLNGEKTITMVDKNFLSLKEFKKFAASTDMSCVQTGKAASCCAKDGIAANTRIYHVTI